MRNPPAVKVGGSESERSLFYDPPAINNQNATEE